MPNDSESDNPSGDPQSGPAPPNPVAPQNGIPRAQQAANANADLVVSETRRELHWLEKLNFGSQISLVIVGIIAATIYGCQLKTMNRTLNEISSQTRAAQESADASDRASLTSQRAERSEERGLQATIDNFHQDQRPYIGLTKDGASDPKIRAVPTASDGSVQIYWNYSVTNYGKSPSKGAYETEQIKLPGEGWQKNYKNTRLRNPSGPIVPTVEVTDTIFSRPMSPAEAQRLMAIKDGIIIRVVISYSDSSNGSYETRICFRHEPGGLPAFCPNDNSIK